MNQSKMSVDSRYPFCWMLPMTIVAVILFVIVPSSFARQGDPPPSVRSDVRSVDTVNAVVLPAIDVASARAKAEQQTQPGPLQVAEGIEMSVTLADGTWETAVDGRQVWRVRIEIPGALHLNFGFGVFDLPEGATLHINSMHDRVSYVGPYTAADNSPNGLWTSMVPGASAVLELNVPAEVSASSVQLEVTRVGAGIIDLFGVRAGPKHEFSACHIDVICPQAAAFAAQTRSVARLLINNAGLCTGTLIKDVPGSFKPFVLTAHHCGITSALAPTVVALFNFNAASCGSHTPGPTTDTISGSTLRATRTDVDGTLIELNSRPSAIYNVFYAGWDRSNNTPYSTVGIHHPQGASKAFAQDHQAPTTVDSCIGSGTNSHWNVTWGLGTTLPGSSGSALFDGTSKNVIGHLSGGSAACNGNGPNGASDCYGKLSLFWSGSDAGDRLSDHLDPAGTGTTMVDGMDPTPLSSPLDLAFVIDTTSSMSDDITAVKASAIEIIETLKSSVIDSRVALVTYRDFPPQGDFAAQTNLDFASEQSEINTAIQAIEVFGGGDTPETVYSGIIHAIHELSWREDVERAIIIMGDAPPHDPEPVTGLTEANVIDAANGMDIGSLPALSSTSISPATTGTATTIRTTLYAILIENHAATRASFTHLAEGTGGKLFEAANADEVVGAVLEAIGVITDPPSAEVLYRVNAGGPTIAALDGGPDWLSDDGFHSGGSRVVTGRTVRGLDSSVLSTTPQAVFETERFHPPDATADLRYDFEVEVGRQVEVRFDMMNGFDGTSEPGKRVFDVEINGNIVLDDVDLSREFGHQIGGMRSVQVSSDGGIRIVFKRNIQAPLVNAIEIVVVDDGESPSTRCTERFGSAPGFILCQATETTCRFNAFTDGSTCQEMCASLGSACVGAIDNDGSSCLEIPGSSDTCESRRETEMCICAR